jgi:DNA-binding transcriptional LysR family regulator
LGVVLLPQELVNDALRKGTLVALLPDYSVPVLPMNLLYTAGRQVTPKVRSFVEFVKGVLGR